MNDLRPELPPLPRRFQRLPIEERGFPVPWFVAWIDEDGKECPVGQGKPDFRIVRSNGVPDAHNQQRCWLCGERLGVHIAFVIGPMCAVNRISSEPPSHVECADFAARACPFLARPHARRREVKLEVGLQKAPGMALKRNPGAALVWITRATRYSPLRVDTGVLFNVGDPEEVRWYCEGRPATRAEIEESIESGLPSLREVVTSDEEMTALNEEVERAMKLLPA